MKKRQSRYREFRRNHETMWLCLTLEEASEFLSLKIDTLEARWRNTRRASNSLRNGRQKTLPVGIEAGLNSSDDRVIMGQRSVLLDWKNHITKNRPEYDQEAKEAAEQPLAG